MVTGYESSALHERIDRSFDILSSAYRRQIIYALLERGSATVAELADAVVSAGLADARDSALASLIHVHLPKLDDFDVVEYDGPDDAVSLGDEAERLEPYLSVAARRETDAESGLPSASSKFEGETQFGVADTSLD